MAQYSDPYENWKAAGRPGGSFATWQASQAAPVPAAAPAPAAAQPTAQPVAAPAAPAGVPTPEQLRAKAKAEGWSEDFDRFDDAQLQRWLSSGLYDPNTGKFRSENDPTGAATYDKPAECPPGTTFHGSKCVSWDQLPYELGGTGSAGPAGGPGGGSPAAAPAFDPTNPLQSQLVNQYQERGNMFSSQQPGGFGESLTGGGIFWGQGGQGAVNPALTAAALNAFTPAAPSQTGGGQPAAKPPLSAASNAGNMQPAMTSAFAGGFTGKGTGDVTTGIQQPTGMIGAAPAPAKPLEGALARQYKDPNKWWMPENRVR